MSGALEGVRVVDVTSNVAGPFATHILAALGAEVVKVERPHTGDDTRGWGPPFWDEVGLTFLDLNRRKESVELDLKDAADRERLLDLIASADVLVQNLRPQSLARAGFGPDEMTARFPRLVYCDISGFGFTGPLADSPAFDPLMQAYSGLMSITGHDDAAPARIPVSMLDKGAGMWAAIGVLAALRDRETTGRGQVVRTSLLETAFGFQAVQAMSYLATDVVPTRLGSGTTGIAPYEAFPTLDGHVVIAAANDRLFRGVCAALDRSDLATEPRYASNAQRFAARAELRDALTELTKVLSTADLMERLGAHSVPAHPVNTIADAVTSPQVDAMRLFQPVDGMADGVVAMRLPVTFDGELDSPATAPPTLGGTTRKETGR
ncbi:CoA transferase [Microbacterium sp. LWH7-1.2]|uniref:CaiB/BaiF CoA transferase family protein n=1 Tax=Microbacterium sp. LWH7-1.2 TaxID=3135257 RepID=UPI003138F1D4